MTKKPEHERQMPELVAGDPREPASLLVELIQLDRAD